MEGQKFRCSEPVRILTVPRSYLYSEIATFFSPIQRRQRTYAHMSHRRSKKKCNVHTRHHAHLCGYLTIERGRVSEPDQMRRSRPTGDIGRIGGICCRFGRTGGDFTWTKKKIAPTRDQIVPSFTPQLY
jgi:hypothetical protein